MSLLARHLEENGIPTVIVGCARDIVEQVGVPRFVFNDFPLGHPCGKPHDDVTQKGILDLAFTTLENAFVPRTTVQSPYRWSNDESWRDRYMRKSDD